MEVNLVLIKLVITIFYKYLLLTCCSCLNICFYYKYFSYLLERSDKKIIECAFHLFLITVFSLAFTWTVLVFVITLAPTRLHSHQWNYKYQNVCDVLKLWVILYNCTGSLLIRTPCFSTDYLWMIDSSTLMSPSRIFI